jgi:diguanylate cyclase (GGDEF)-like protein
VSPLEKSAKPPSHLITKFDLTVERWAVFLPPHLQDSFRADFQWFGAQHEAALDILEGIWERREHAYAFDESTGLATRRPFHEYLTTLLNEPPSPGLTAVGVLFIDVNDLKRVNDTCGHQVGDRAIAAIGAIIRETLRVEQRVDTVTRVSDDAYAVARHGGDEFAAALQLADSAEIEHIAPRVKQRVDDPARQRAWGYQGPVDLTVSVGGVVYELPANPPRASLNSLATALLTAADTLMYESKRDGFIHVALSRFTDKLEVHGGRRIPVP